MPTSATGISIRSPRHLPGSAASGGFSLLELLVVLLIIGIILTMATLAIGPGINRDRGSNEAQRLYALLALARDQAILQGIEHGLEVHADGYRVMALIDGRWSPLDDLPPWRPRTLPPTVILQLRSEGVEINLANDQADGPQLLLLSSGETTPFEIELSDPTGSCILRGDGISDLAPPHCKAG